MKHFALIAVVLLIYPGSGSVRAGGTEDVAFAQTIRPLLQKYCIDCHGGKKPKGNLALDTLTSDFQQPKAMVVWKDVEERLASGTMPPRSKPQPSAAEFKALHAWINARLVAADLARQKVEGRAVLRRLNRIEYENTVRTLLAINVDLKNHLPEDDSVDGFDNVGGALTISPVLMERYLEAADAALNAAIFKGPRPKEIKARHSFHGESLLKERSGPKAGNIRKVEDGVVFLSSQPMLLRQFRPPMRGLYRFRIAANSVDNDGKSLYFKIFGSNDMPAGSFHLADAKPTIIEFEGIWGPRDSLQLSAQGLGRPIYIPNLAAHKGPGLAVQWVEVEGPILHDWPPESHRRVFGNVELKSAKLADAERLLRDFVPRAFRKPVTDAQIKPFVDLVKANLDKKYSFEDALRVGLRAVLCSPNFLFLDEAPGRLDDYALANRLSYFLWKSLPDQQLLDLAKQKKLHASVRGQVERMLKDPKAAALTEQFLGQWLDLRLIDVNPPDKKLYPEFNELLQYSMRRETELFFEEILNNDLSLLNFVDSDFSMLNEPLTRHYKLAPVEGIEFRKVKLPAGSHRGGVLTHGSVLKVTANGTTTSPVLRGVWVLKNIMGQSVPPPPDVPSVEPDIRGATTIREQLAKHRQEASCAACHQKIDPPGFALESFDVIGGWRENYRTLRTDKKVYIKPGLPEYLQGPKVDAGDITPDGKRFKDIDEFKKILLADPDRVARCVAEKLIIYATGTTIRPADRKTIDGIVANVRAKNYGLRTLVHEIVQSELFLHK